MSQRSIRCGHCGNPHPITETVCASTGLPIHSPSRPAPPVAEPPSGRHAASSVQRDLVGRTIDGKYRVLSVLGQGGMGTVFEAENIAVGRTVAVKVLHPAQAQKKVAVKRFHQEARAAGKIGHPNICEVYDLGSLTDGAPFLVMEKLVGVTLAERIARDGGLPFEDCIDIVNQVLSGLAAAHQKGIVHRDIKPENVFLTERAGCPSLVKILDFGVSKMTAAASGSDDDLDLTRTGMVMGTPFYMSPEQARGERNLDARVDLWASGVILYEALTGRRPFVAPNYNALLLQILTATPIAVRTLRPALPEGFDSILDRAMARAREQRYQDASEFQRDLHALRSSIGVPSPARVPPVVLPAIAHPKREAAVDPLLRLPSLAGAEDDESGTHFALDMVESGETSMRDAPPLERASAFDDVPTEIVHNSWDDETTRRPSELAVEYLRSARAKAQAAARPATQDVEETVKIEGDIEAHFAEMHPEGTEKPGGKRGPR